MYLRTIEGLGCEEMGIRCFMSCRLLQSMKGWPASMTVIPMYCFVNCTGTTKVDCDLSHATSTGYNAFWGCTSLLPPSLSQLTADPAAVLAFPKRKLRGRARARALRHLRERAARPQRGEPAEAGARPRPRSRSPSPSCPRTWPSNAASW
jgi:hypothetical protein